MKIHTKSQAGLTITIPLQESLKKITLKAEAKDSHRTWLNTNPCLSTTTLQELLPLEKSAITSIKQPYIQTYIENVCLSEKLLKAHHATISLYNHFRYVSWQMNKDSYSYTVNSIVKA